MTATGNGLVLPRPRPRGVTAALAARPGRVQPAALATLAVCAVVALVCLVGADARWLDALGGVVAQRHGVPVGVPFAAAPSAHWPNVPVLGELIFHGLRAGLGDRGLVVAQLLAVAVALSLLARDAQARGVEPRVAAVRLLLLAVGASATLAIARAQLFSLALFPLLVVLLRRDARAANARVWLVVPLLALWSNLHGGAILGLGITLIYLGLGPSSRSWPQRLLLGAAAAGALCLTPAGLHTPDYYRGVLDNQAAARGQGLWTPLTLTSAEDLMLVAGMGLLAARVRWRLLARWELGVLLLLAIMTVRAGRSGVWLLFFLAPLPAGALLRRRAATSSPALGWVATAVAAAALALALIHGPAPSGASASLLHRALGLAHGAPVLAEDIVAEQLADSGGRVWVSNPLDAFPAAVQAGYLDWSEGRPTGWGTIPPSVTVVLALRGSAAARLTANTRAFALIEEDRGVELFLRRAAPRLSLP